MPYHAFFSYQVQFDTFFTVHTATFIKFPKVYTVCRSIISPCCLSPFSLLCYPMPLRLSPVVRYRLILSVYDNFLRCVFYVPVRCYQCISSPYGTVLDAPHLSPQAGCGDPFSSSRIETCTGNYCVVGIYPFRTPIRPYLPMRYFPKPAISARKNGRFSKIFHIFPDWNQQKSIYLTQGSNISN